MSMVITESVPSIALSLASASIALSEASGASEEEHPGVAVYDTFTDTDSTALTAHVPDKGAAWTHINGTYQIASNRAAWVSNGSPAFALAAIESNKADCTVSGIVKRTASGYVGIACRIVDIQNYLIFTIYQGNKFQVIRRYQNNIAVLGEVSVTTAINTNYIIQVVLSGSSIVATLDGGSTISVTYANLTTATKHGFYNEVAGNFDNFQVV